MARPTQLSLPWRCRNLCTKTNCPGLLSISCEWALSACRVPYIIGLLQDGLSLSEEKLSIGNGREGWTLGAALAEGGRVGIGRPILEQVRVGRGCMECIQSVPVSNVEAVQAQDVAG